MKNDIVKGLISVANSLDSKGFGKEADQLDRIMRKIAERYEGPGTASTVRGQDGDTVDEAIAEAMDLEPSLTYDDIYVSAYGGGITFANVSPGKAMLIWRANADINENWLFKLFSKRNGGELWRMYTEAGGPDEDVPESEESPDVARQAPSPKRTKECTPNGQPLIRLPGDNTYGYQLADDGKSYRAYRLSDCKYLGTFDDEAGTSKVKGAAPKAAPSETPSEPSQGPEITKEVSENMPVAPPPDAMAELLALRDRVKAAEDTRRFEQTAEVVREAQRLLGIKNITPFAPGVRRKYLQRLIERGIEKLQGDSADDLFMSEAASRSSDRISKFASLLSGEFGGLDKKVRR